MEIKNSSEGVNWETATTAITREGFDGRMERDIRKGILGSTIFMATFLEELTGVAS